MTEQEANKSRSDQLANLFQMRKLVRGVKRGRF